MFTLSTETLQQKFISHPLLNTSTREEELCSSEVRQLYMQYKQKMYRIVLKRLKVVMGLTTTGFTFYIIFSISVIKCLKFSLRLRILFKQKSLYLHMSPLFRTYIFLFCFYIEVSEASYYKVGDNQNG